MFKELLSKLNPYSQFDPKPANKVTASDLEKILNGKVKNPNKWKCDYAYFVICDEGLNELYHLSNPSFNSFIDPIETIFYKSKWFGKFYCDSTSKIVVPHEKIILLSPKDELVKYHVQEFTGNVWQGGGFFQYDKEFGIKIIPTDISLDKMKSIVKKEYAKYDRFKSLLKL